MSTYTQAEIASLIQHFESRTLPKSEWTHEAHLIVGIWYAWHYPFEEALARLREGIFCYNEAVGTENTDSSGYHETITQFWLKLASSFLTNTTFSTVEEACKGFLASSYIHKGYLFNFYSREHLFSVQARKNWVEPDLKPFDFEIKPHL